MENSAVETAFGEALRHVRREMGWSQEAVAEAMRSRGFDFHQTSVSKTETAERSVRLAEADALADVFGIPLWTMLAGPDMGHRRRLGEYARALRDARAAREALDDAELAARRADEHLAEMTARISGLEGAVLGDDVADAMEANTGGPGDGEHQAAG